MFTGFIITKPAKDEYPEWFAGEIELVHYTNLIPGLEDSFRLTVPFLEMLDEETLRYRYAPGKWSIKQMWQHVMDVERVLSYRALRYSRGDQTVLSGFNENVYAENSDADRRPWPDILREYAAVRESTLHLFCSFTPDMVEKRGTTGKSNMTVRSVGYLILGHEIHHVGTIRERYLKP
jgi:DinB superfamily